MDFLDLPIDFLAFHSDFSDVPFDVLAFPVDVIDFLRSITRVVTSHNRKQFARVLCCSSIAEKLAGTTQFHLWSITDIIGVPRN